ncbi:serine--tRNA ligase [bacterium]|nr:serine--tRNA ligase [bacterium]
MLDLRYLRNNPNEAEDRLRNRDPEVSLERLKALDSAWRNVLQRVEEIRAERNEIGEAIAVAKKAGESVTEAIERMGIFKEELSKIEEQEKEFKSQLDDELLGLPNLPDPRVPVSFDSDDAEELRVGGELPDHDFEPRDHVELAEPLGLLDFPASARLTGAGFAVYRKEAALLEWALLSWMFKNAAEHGYEPVLLPFLVNARSLYTSSQLPKFMGDVYKLADDDLYLIPTSEVPLVNLGREMTYKEQELPRRFTSVTANFRREAGTYGRDTRGLVRTHQFNKVELVAITAPEQAEGVFEEMIAIAEEIPQRLGLRWRTIMLVTGDMAQQASVTVDVEVWCPGMKRWWEISSVSNCTDYQARRGGIRYKPADAGKSRFCYTLNGSAVATSRLLPAILETHQRANGSIVIPEPLRAYVGKEVIGGK